MLKKVIEYEDFNGEKRKETFYFNLTKAELAEMELSVDGGLLQRINKIVETQDITEIVKLFKSIILDSYGEKSEDGRSFVKTAEVRENFSYTAAYSELFMELSSDAGAATAFINGIAPADLAGQVIPSKSS